MEHERRLKVAYLDPDELVTVLNWLHEPQGTRLRMLGAGVPEEAKVHHCYYDPSRRALAVLLMHESFPEVDTGDMLPSIEGELHISMEFIEKDSVQLPAELREGIHQAMLVDGKITRATQLAYPMTIVEEYRPSEGPVVKSVTPAENEESAGEFFQRKMGIEG